MNNQRNRDSKSNNDVDSFIKPAIGIKLHKESGGFRLHSNIKMIIKIIKQILNERMNIFYKLIYIKFEHITHEIDMFD